MERVEDFGQKQHSAMFAILYLTYAPKQHETGRDQAMLEALNIFFRQMLESIRIFCIHWTILL